MAVDRVVLVKHLNGILSVAEIPDTSCNGLQVEGAEDISVVGLAVDACLSAYKKAVDGACQFLITHHGLIWKGLTCVSGAVRTQIDFLLRHDLNLYAAHLPLDMHAQFGNNIELARILGLSDIRAFGLYHGTTIGFTGALSRPMSAEEIGALVSSAIGGTHSSLPFGKSENRTVAVISGGGSEALPEAIEKRIDCFVTGEPVHWNHHLALEARINVVYCGHYHTETLGVKALGRHLEKTFDVKTVFIDEPTLV